MNTRPKSWDDPDQMDRQVLMYEYKLLKSKYETMQKEHETLKKRYSKLYYFAAYDVYGGDRFDGWHSDGGKMAWKLPGDKLTEKAEACEREAQD